MIPGGLLPIHHRRLLAWDDFSEANGTAIIGKSLDIGGTWLEQLTNSTGVLAVNAGRGGLSLNTSIRIAVCSALDMLDCSVSGGLKTTISAEHCSLVAKSNGVVYVANSAGSWIEGRIYGSGELRIMQALNGVISTLNTVITGTTVFGTSQDCALIINGTSAVFVTPVGAVSATINSGLLNNTRCGFRFANGTGTTGQSIDNFTVEAY